MKYTFIELRSSAQPHLVLHLCLRTWKVTLALTYDWCVRRLLWDQSERSLMHSSHIRRVGQHVPINDRRVLLSVPEWALHAIFLHRRHWHACNPAGNRDDGWLPGGYRAHQAFGPKLDGQIHSLGDRVRVCLTTERTAAVLTGVTSKVLSLHITNYEATAE